VTPTHPFYVDGLGWTASGDLVAGEQLNSPDGQTLTVIANQDEPEFSATTAISASPVGSVEPPKLARDEPWKRT
jgi:hypothetical protein